MEPAGIMQWIDASTVAAHKYGQCHNPSIVDGSLTSLNWLPDFKIPSIDDRSSANAVHAKLPSSTSYCVVSSSSTSDSASSTDSVAQESEPEKDECFLPLSPIKRCISQTAEFEKNPSRFEENPSKPPFSYTTIIYLAIRSCDKEKVMLGDIYQWIKDHFKYYRIAESTWQNSVRHNLSLNQFFRKIPRGEGDPGKGSFWQINPEYEHLLNNDKELQRLVQQQNCVKTPLQRKRSKNRKKSTSSCSSSSCSNGGRDTNHKREKTKRQGSSTLSPPDPCHLPGDLDWVSLLSSQKFGCASCNEGHHCRPSFGTPLLGIGELGESTVTCSPAIAPVSLPNKIPDMSPPNSDQRTVCLEEIITTQESPAPLLPPWAAENRPYSPTMEHPWAESNTRVHEVSSPFIRRGQWSPPEVMWNTSNPQITRSNKLQIPQLI